MHSLRSCPGPHGPEAVRAVSGVASRAGPEATQYRGGTRAGECPAAGAAVGAASRRGVHQVRGDAGSVRPSVLPSLSAPCRDSDTTVDTGGGWSMTGEGVTRARYRREGRCVRCGRTRTPARLTCARCQGLATQARARFRTTGRGAQYRREGRCRCGHPRDLAGVTCSRCLRGNDERLAHWRAGHARIRASRRFLSACLTCGGILAPHSRSMCVRHLTAARRRRRVLSLARVSTGQCIRCNRPREVERLSQCASCRATQRARDARNRAAGTFVAVHTPAGGTRTVRGIGESVRRGSGPYGGAGPVGVVGVQTKRRGVRLGVLKIGRV